MPQNKPNHPTGYRQAMEVFRERTKDIDREQAAIDDHTPSLPKRTDDQILEDRVQIIKMALEGYTQGEIAEWLNHHRPYRLGVTQIWKDLKAVRKQWVEMYLTDYDQLKAQEIARIDNLERAAWEAFYRSVNDKETIVSTKVDDHTGASNTDAKVIGSTYSRTKIEGKKEKRDGDVKFFDTIKWCIEQRCKIYGFNAPTTQNLIVDWKEEAKKNGIANPSEMFNELVARFVAEGTSDGDESNVRAGQNGSLLARDDDEGSMGNGSED